MWPTGYEKVRIWPIQVNGSTAVASSILLIFSPGMTHWEADVFRTLDQGSCFWATLKQTHDVVIRFKLPMACKSSQDFLCVLGLWSWEWSCEFSFPSCETLGTQCKAIRDGAWMRRLWEMLVVLFLVVHCREKTKLVLMQQIQRDDYPEEY